MLAALALLAGALIALQAGINSQLGVLLRNSMLATSVAFLLSALVSVGILIAFTRVIPDWDTLKSVPAPFWFGGVLSALGVGLFYFLIPKMGVGTMMSLALTGQLLVAMLISHFGWFGLPVLTINGSKLLGVAAMIGGIILINR